MSFIFSPTMIYAPFARFQNCQESKIIFKLAVATLNRRKGWESNAFDFGNWELIMWNYEKAIRNAYLSRSFDDGHQL